MEIYDYHTGKGVSLPMEVEKRQLQIREEYLLWVHRLGNADAGNGKSVKESLGLGGISFWWLTLIAEKSPYKTPLMYQVFKLRALELCIGESMEKEFTFHSADRRLKQPLSEFAKSKGISIIWADEKPAQEKKQGMKRWLFGKLPHFFRGTLWLAGQSMFRRAGSIKQSANELTVVTYFPGIDMKKAAEGKFKSSYWGDIGELFSRMGIKVNWVWLHSDSQGIDYQKAREMRDRLNLGSSDRFCLLEEFVGGSGVIFADYLRMYFRSRRLLKKGFFSLPGSAINFYSIYEDDWKSSLIGKAMAENVLWLHGFSGMCKKLSRQKACLYLCEMAAWEKVLVSECKKRGTKTVGFQHASVREMDLRCFEHQLTYRGKGPLPLPDILAANGKLAQGYFEKAGYPGKIRLVEALRHNYLAGIAPAKGRTKTLLVVTGYLYGECHAQLSMLRDAMGTASSLFEKIVIKPHPDFPVEKMVSGMGMDGKVEISGEKMPALLAQCDLVFAANGTTVSAESASLGIPTIVAGPEGSLNLAPISGRDLFAYDSGELARKMEKPPKAKLEVFCVDASLKRWEKLLKEIIGS